MEQIVTINKHCIWLLREDMKKSSSVYCLEEPILMQGMLVAGQHYIALQ
jgi:hypothetical protein